MGVIAPIRTGGPVLTPYPALRGYQYLAPFAFNAGGHDFTIPAGYVIDGASVPTLIGLLHRAMFNPFDPRVMDGAGRHDWLCDAKPSHVPSDVAAADFQRVIERDGIGATKAELAFQGVNRFGPQWGKRRD